MHDSRCSITYSASMHKKALMCNTRKKDISDSDEVFSALVSVSGAFDALLTSTRADCLRDYLA